MEAHIERYAAPEAENPHRTKSSAHQLRIGHRIGPAAVLGEEAALRNGVQSGKKRQSLIKDRARDVTVRAFPKSFNARSGRMAAAAGICCASGDPQLLTDHSRGDLREELELIRRGTCRPEIWLEPRIRSYATAAKRSAARANALTFSASDAGAAKRVAVDFTNAYLRARA